jgi:hypothetical protein
MTTATEAPWQPFLDEMIEENKNNRTVCETNYLGAFFKQSVFFATLQRCCVALKEMNDTIGFDTIVVRGMSGALMGGAVRAITGYPLTILRKRAERSHSWMDAEGTIELFKINKYIFLDDLVDSGKTLKIVHKEMNRLAKESRNTPIEMVGIVLYATAPSRYSRPSLSQVEHKFKIKTVKKISFCGN